MVSEFVLVVEDDDDVRDSIEDVLALDGHHVVGVENGEQALGALAVAMPCAVVTDLSMPMRTGYSLIAHMRGQERMRGIPVCVVSADTTAAPQGTFAIRKPFELGELRDTVRRALRRH
jgi:DNA-binding NtrC family response regulator